MTHNNLQVIFRGIPTSRGVSELIARKLDKLEKQHTRIQRCRVVIDRPHQHHQKGQRFHVTVDLSIPNDELVVCKGEHEKGYENVYVAVRDAFTAVQKQMQRSMTRKRRHVRYVPGPELSESVLAG